MKLQRSISVSFGVSYVILFHSGTNYFTKVQQSKVDQSIFTRRRYINI